MTSPATAPPAPATPGSALTRVEQKLDRLERRLAFLDQLPAVLEVGATTVDDLARTHQLHQRVEKALHLVETLTRPEMLAKLEQLAAIASMLPDQLSTAMGTLDDIADGAQKRGVDMGSAIPDVVDMLATMVRALQCARTCQDQPGLFAMLAAPRDPHVSRAFGFLIAFARILGQDLESQQSALPTGSASK